MGDLDEARSVFLASAWPRAGCCSHLWNSGLVDGKSLSASSFFLSVINKSNNSNKKDIFRSSTVCSFQTFSSFFFPLTLPQPTLITELNRCLLRLFRQPQPLEWFSFFCLFLVFSRIIVLTLKTAFNKMFLAGKAPRSSVCNHYLLVAYNQVYSGLLEGCSHNVFGLNHEKSINFMDASNLMDCGKRTLMCLLESGTISTGGIVVLSMQHAHSRKRER